MLEAHQANFLTTDCVAVAVAVVQEKQQLAVTATPTVSVAEAANSTAAGTSGQLRHLRATCSEEAANVRARQRTLTHIKKFFSSSLAT